MEELRVLTPDERRFAVGQLHGLMSAAMCRVLEFVAVMDEQGDWVADGAIDGAQWLVAEFGVTSGTAKEWVRVACALRELPAIREAFGRGALSFDQVRELTRVATPETDPALAREGAVLTAAQLRRMARRAKPVSAEEVADAHLRRAFTLTFDEARHEYTLRGRLPQADGATVAKALEMIASDAPRDPATGTCEPYEARCADALVELAGRALAESPDADRATVVVHVDADVLAGQDGPAELEPGIALTTEAARRLACDARLQIVADGADGLPVGIGRTARNVPRWMRRQLHHRDGGCRFPGCGRKARLAAHHKMFWGRGGRTDLDNLLLLCPFHHRLVHEGGWRIEGDPNGSLTFVRPDGLVRKTGPPPIRRDVAERFFGTDEEDPRAG